MNEEDERRILGSGSTDDDGVSDPVRTFNHHQLIDISDKSPASVVRCFVVTILLALAIVISNATFITVLNRERTVMTEKVNSHAEALVANARNNIEGHIWTADSLSQEFSLFAEHHRTRVNSTAWPFVGLPDFKQRCADFGSLTSVSSVWFAPFFSESERSDWEAYASSADPFATADDGMNETQSGATSYGNETVTLDQPNSSTYRDSKQTRHGGIFRFEDGNAVTDSVSDFFAPIWQVRDFGSTLHNSTILFNQWSDGTRKEALSQVLRTKGSVLSRPLKPSNDSFRLRRESPTSALYSPVFEGPRGSSPRGAITLEFSWESLFQNRLSGVADPVVVVLESSCDQEYRYSFEANSENVTYLGEGDLHDTSIREMFANSSLFAPATHTSTTRIYLRDDAPFIRSSSICAYYVNVYPTAEMKLRYMTSMPFYLQGGIAHAFFITCVGFVAYDCLLERRQREVMISMARSSAIVNSLFPANVRDRLYEHTEIDEEGTDRSSTFLVHTPKLRLKTFLTRSDTPRALDRETYNSEPIADLFPHSTVLCADIAGFTAWSSEREPSQVFTLLESLFGVMDKVAMSLGVFKVETVGDCYVAATGLPDPQDDHAIIMARFANSCLQKVRALLDSLESILGPGTGNLAMRFGIHSGPVTAGVLRGEKSRFQLFGDTLDKAARMESTSKPNKIHISKETAVLIRTAGKENWLASRTDGTTFAVDGKRKQETFWLRLKAHTPRRYSDIKEEKLQMSERLSSTRELMGQETGWANSLVATGSSIKLERLIDWNVEELLQILRRVVARRNAISRKKHPGEKKSIGEEESDRSSRRVLDEVVETVALAQFNPNLSVFNEEDVLLDPKLRSELRDYVANIAAAYEDNPFHNFEHASHVCLSSNKLLKRIVFSDDVDYCIRSNETGMRNIDDIASDLHNHTYGISSDPLAHFAIVFSALIHDVGHTGVPNVQLAKERPDMSERYGHQSVAEQRSVDIAWDLLMDSAYERLRGCICPTIQERKRFRQLVVNTVMATDIFDKELGTLRKARWNKAFSFQEGPVREIESDYTIMNRKATIVLEHIVQASDVSHTMQHWHIFTRWNERLFQEMYRAYKAGRSETDPSDVWYEGELQFFDKYVIPLARKLKECGVFGVSSDEYLNYALANRDEWERKGKRLVQRMSSRHDSSLSFGSYSTHGQLGSHSDHSQLGNHSAHARRRSIW